AGGKSLFGDHAGPKDQRETEARPDVLTYTSAAMTADVTVIGPIDVELFVRSSVDHTDFFVRLCDVDEKGKSINLCAGLIRLSPSSIDRDADGVFRVAFNVTPTANTFRVGHRIRVQVASGGFPLYARNPGSGEPLAKATTFVAADQQVLHDPAHPSAITL